MCKEVRRELIVVPHEGVVPVVCDALEGDLRKVFVHDESVEAMHEDVDACRLCRRAQPSFLGIVRVAPSVEAVFRCQCQLAEHKLSVALSFLVPKSLMVGIVVIAQCQSCLDDRA